MLEDAANVIDRRLAEVRVRAPLEELILAAFPKALVHMHARTVVLEEWLRHERHRLVVPASDTLDNVLVLQKLVAHAS